MRTPFAALTASATTLFVLAIPHAVALANVVPVTQGRLNR